jgi:hypothetical protein
MQVLRKPYEFTANERWTLVLMFCGLAYVAGMAYLPQATRWHPWVCPCYHFLGLHCPGCGLTRASAALLRLDLPLALTQNPLVLFLAVYVGYRMAHLGVGLASGRQLVGRWPRWFVIGTQIAFAAVWVLLFVIRTATWLVPGLNPQGWGIPV